MTDADACDEDRTTTLLRRAYAKLSTALEARQTDGSVEQLAEIVDTMWPEVDAAREEQIRGDEREKVIAELQHFADHEGRLGLGEYNGMRWMAPMLIRGDREKLPLPNASAKPSVGELTGRLAAALNVALSHARPTDPTSRDELAGCLDVLADAVRALHGPDAKPTEHPHLTVPQEVS